MPIDDAPPQLSGLIDLDEPTEPELSAELLAMPPLSDVTEGEERIRTGDEWGFVDDEGNIHLRAGRLLKERIIGRVHSEDRAGTLAALVLRFSELEQRFAALEGEVRSSAQPARHIKSVRSFIHWVAGAQALGDFDRLLQRACRLIAELETGMKQSRVTKLALAEKAEALADSTQWKATGEAMEELMGAWKQAGSAGREEDEALWQRFHAARSTFFARRGEHYSELKHTRAASREAKESVIARAEVLATSSEWKATGEAFNELMEEWKQAGSAGREHDEELWQRFSAARQQFFSRRSEHFGELKRIHAAAREAKESIIARAEELATSTEWRETGDAYAALMDEWKQAGSAGRDHDEELWQRFRGARQQFYDRREAAFAEQRQRRGDRPRGEERGERPRRPGGRRNTGGQERRPSEPPGVLRQSLADVLGPMKGLFPAKPPKPPEGKG